MGFKCQKERKLDLVVHLHRQDRRHRVLHRQDRRHRVLHRRGRRHHVLHRQGRRHQVAVKDVVN